MSYEGRIADHCKKIDAFNKIVKKVDANSFIIYYCDHCTEMFDQWLLLAYHIIKEHPEVLEDE